MYLASPVRVSAVDKLDHERMHQTFDSSGSSIVYLRIKRIKPAAFEF
jgi:hypothetical protein